MWLLTSMRSALVGAPIIQPLDWSQPFKIMCDTSDYAVAAFLGQRKEGRVHIVYYASKTINEAQLNYATMEKELLALVLTVNGCIKVRLDLQADKSLVVVKGPFFP
jgi:hypothetical protein